MRCARCDHPVVPQAVGQTPEGVLVFGWCLDCLQASGCREIVVARRSRGSTTRLVLERRPPRLLRPPNESQERRAHLLIIYLIMGAWGIALISVGLTLLALGLPRQRSPLGNGSPALMIVGGGLTASVALILLAVHAGRSRVRLLLRAICYFGFAMASLPLLAGIIFRSPRRDSLFVMLAMAGLLVSATARWLEGRTFAAQEGRGIAGATRPDLSVEEL